MNNIKVYDIKWLKFQMLKICYWNIGGRESDMERDLIITKVKDNHGEIGTIFFSINGSPPKARAILHINSFAFQDPENNIFTGVLCYIDIYGKKLRFYNSRKDSLNTITLDLNEFKGVIYG